MIVCCAMKFLRSIGAEGERREEKRVEDSLEWKILVVDMYKMES